MDGQKESSHALAHLQISTVTGPWPFSAVGRSGASSGSWHVAACGKSLFSSLSIFLSVDVPFK